MSLMPARFSGSPGFPAALAAAGCALAASAATAACLADDRQVFLATGLWALAILLLPLALRPRRDLFAMWSFVLLTAILGLVLRGACLAWGYPDAARLDELYLLGREPSYFFGPAALLLLGLFFLALGQAAFPFQPRPRTAAFLEPRRVAWLGLALLAVSGAATVLYIRETGGLDAGLWSAKRAVIPSLDLAGSGYQSRGGLRFLASLAIHGHLLVLAEVLSPGRRKARPALWLLAAALLLVACAVPFYASLRTHLAFNLCLSAAMFYYSGVRFRGAVLAAAAAAALLGVQAMTALRPGLGDGEAAPSARRAFDAAVINRNQIELPKTAHVIRAVPGELSFQHGRTIARWLLAPVPRGLWPDKPVIPPGPEIGNAVYGQRVAGVPPSLVAELYWNFHLPGIILGGFGLGVLLSWLQARFQPRPGGGDLLRAALYAAGPMTLGLEAVGGSIGSGLYRAALQGGAMALLIHLASRRFPPSLPRQL